jgi:hypothetical protein
VTADDGSARRPAGRDVEAADGGPAGDERITVRLVMPDRWLEQVEELPLSATVEAAKALGLRKMLQRGTDDPDDFYVEYAERQVPDESVTLGELGVQPREILSIRAYDLGHYPRFEG